MSYVYAFSMHTYSLFNILVIFELLGTSLIVFLSFHLFLFTLVMSMATKRKSTLARNLFVPELLHLLILLLSLFDSMMMMPTRHSRRTFLDEVFIQNTKSFWRTSSTLTFPLSFIVGNGSHYVTSQSLVLSCSSRSFTPTCTGLII